MAKISRRQFVYGAGALALAVAGAETFLSIRGGGGGRPENIILVIADAMRADCIGKSINGQEVTPNLNRLAGQSVCFRNAYSSSSFTKTSMASIFSGM